MISQLLSYQTVNVLCATLQNMIYWSKINYNYPCHFQFYIKLWFQRCPKFLLQRQLKVHSKSTGSHVPYLLFQSYGIQKGNDRWIQRSVVVSETDYAMSKFCWYTWALQFSHQGFPYNYVTNIVLPSRNKHWCFKCCSKHSYYRDLSRTLPFVSYWGLEGKAK